jgi:hypothetical protein
MKKYEMLFISGSEKIIEIFDSIKVRIILILLIMTSIIIPQYIKKLILQKQHFKTI